MVQAQSGKEDVEKFFESLSERELESVERALSDWVSECCEAKLKHNEENLRSLKAEIDKVNRKREYLSAQLSLSSKAMEVLDKHFSENPGSLVLTLLKDVLATKVADLRREIHVLKPEHKLKKKAEFRRERDALLRRRDIALMILRIRKGNNEEK